MLLEDQIGFTVSIVYLGWLENIIRRTFDGDGRGRGKTAKTRTLHIYFPASRQRGNTFFPNQFQLF